MSAAEIAQLVASGGLLVAAAGAIYWGGLISAGMRQLQDTMKDHEKRLRAGGL